MKIWQAYSIFFLIAICWGLGFPMTKEGMEHLGPVSFMFGRFVLATLMIVAIRPRAVLQLLPKEILVGGSLGLCLGLGFIVQTIGLETTSSGKTGFITTLNILIVPVLGAFLFGNKLARKDRLAIALALVGFALLSFQSFSEGIASGDFWILACAFFYAFQILGVDRYARDLHPYRVNLAQMISATLLCGLVAFFREDNIWSDYQAATFPLVLTSVLSVAFPFVAQIYAQKYISPSAAALIMSLEAVFAVLFGWMIHQEMLSFQEYLGCVIILAGTTLLLSPQNSWRFFARRFLRTQ